MGITFAKLLEYFGVTELKDVLREINELQTGTRPELAKRVYNKWLTYNRKVEDLLDFLNDGTLETICYDYHLGGEGNRETLKRRIKNDLKGNKPKPQNQVNLEPKKSIQTNQRKYLTVGGIIAGILILTTIVANLTTIIDWIEKQSNEKNLPEKIPHVALYVEFTREPDDTTFTVITLSNNGTTAATNLKVTINPSHDIIGSPNKEFMPDDFQLDMTGERALVAKIPRLSSCSKVMMSVITNSVLENEHFIIYVTSDQGNTIKFDSDKDGKKIHDVNSKFDMSLPC